MTRADRGEMSTADMLLAISRLGIGDEGLALLRSVMFGAEPSAVPDPPAESSPTESPASVALPDQGPDIAVDVPRPAGEGPPIRARIEEVADSGAGPPWLAAPERLEIKPFPLEQVPVPPPVSPIVARNALSPLVRLTTAGRHIDLAALVRRAAEAKPFMPVPMRPDRRVAPFVQVLFDIGEGMEPYVSDVWFLVDQLRDVAGRERSEARPFIGTPLRGLDADLLSGAGATPWETPEPGTLLVIISDLGVTRPVGGRRDKASPREWHDFADAVAESAAKVLVLTPLPRHRWPQGLTSGLRVLAWEDIDTAGTAHV
ncbi:hypothetical protein [Actinoplanes sp. NPDC049681]|uniref:hypothetical protein n=1 Tax=Actinoplanes sp. NPDC049681 TaxID=3363905 RepID=UPI0037A2122A